MRRLFALALCLAACRPAPSSPQGAASAPPPVAGKPQSVVLISIDALRADHLGCYGYGRATSPHIDALASQGALFENAFSPTTWTLPGHASMLTGMTPYRHGASEDGRRIRDDVPLLSELLKQRGYATSAVINGPYLAKEFGFDRGFDKFVERYRERRELPDYQPLVLENLRAMKEPFFLFVHYISVHNPYRPFPEFNKWAKRSANGSDGRGLRQLELDLEAGKATVSAEERQQLVDLYDGEILTIDHHIAEFVEVLRKEVSSDALLILTADHGEEFLEHGGLTHGQRLYDELLRVPLIVVGPGVKPGVRVPGMASLTDIMPTVLGWLGAEVPAETEGVSLAGALRGEPAGQLRNRTLPLHTRAGDTRVNLWGLRTASAKLIVDQQTGKKEFYDLVADPGERKNLYPTEEARRLERQMEKLTLAPSSRERVKHDKNREEVLRSLGYR